MYSRTFFVCCWVVAFLLLASQDGLFGKKEKSEESLRKEEQEDYYRKWLKEDVFYIITEEEKNVFDRLSTGEEKEQFIEQFWFRRDEDPRTALNEFKEEHYRRIAYANERFHSGKPGWMTDRGRIYIIHGPPAEIQAYPSGGLYDRPFHEGGGTTTVHPFEMWRYRYIEGIGNDIELEFVDDSYSGEYRLALNPEEKDAMLHIPGGGLTWAESVGLAKKKDRPYFSGQFGNPAYQSGRAKDNPFTRYETFAKVQAPLPIKYQDLKELVKVNIGYSNLPFQVRSDYFRLNEKEVLVPITLLLQNKDMTFKKEGDVHTARVAVYGIITSMTSRIITEFEFDLAVSNRNRQEGLRKRSMYQKIVSLGNKMRYKLDLIVKDLNSGSIGAVKKALLPPSYGEERLTGSSLILSDSIQQLREIPEHDQMFVLGDVWIRPKMNKQFSPAKPLGVYLQLYNVTMDQTSLAPSLRVNYRITKDGQVFRSVSDRLGESIQFFSKQRVVLIRQVDLKGLQPGTYHVEVEAWDQVNDQKVDVQDSFQIAG